MSEKSICFISCGNADILINRDYLLYEHFAKVFDRLFFLDISNVFTSALKFGGSTIGNADMLPPKYEIVCPKSLSECKNFLKSHNMVAIHYFSQEWHDWWLYYYLKKYSIPLIYIHILSTVVSFKIKKRAIDFISVRVGRRLRSVPFRVFYFLISHGYFSKVDTYFLANKKKAEAKKNDGRYEEIVLVNSSFYDGMLLNNFKVSNDYIVFVDSIVPYALDQIRYGYKPADRELYYKNLNKVLDITGATLGKEVVVCLHTKYNEANLHRDFGERTAVKYRTQEFVAKAELVLFHESSAINSAIIYGKKIVQLVGSQFNAFVKNNCECYQKLLSFPTLDMYDCEEQRIQEIINRPRLDVEKYDAFLSNFTKASEQKEVPSCVQIASHISRKYGIPKRDEDNGGLPAKRVF